MLLRIRNRRQMPRKQLQMLIRRPLIKQLQKDGYVSFEPPSKRKAAAAVKRHIKKLQRESRRFERSY